MKKPKKLFISGYNVRVLSADEKFRICSSRSNAALKRDGYKVKKDRKYMFEVFAGIDDEMPYVIDGDLGDLTAAKAKAAAQWWLQVGKWLEAREKK